MNTYEVTLADDSKHLVQAHRFTWADLLMFVREDEADSLKEIVAAFQGRLVISVKLVQQ